MQTPLPEAVTRLLDEASRGRAGALDEVFPVLYDELRRLARVVRAGRAGETLDTSALVHEAYLKLVRSDGMAWDGRRHFFRVAARAMRQVLVADAERRRAGKRGRAETLVDGLHGAPATPDDVLALHEALGRLGALDARQADTVELRYFAGLTLAETAGVLGVSVPTVTRDWALARVWLAHDLAR